jgi:hypothetical protein
VLAGLRAVYELVWAWLLVTAIGLSPYAGVLALAIPYAGILGRMYAERLNDVPEAPVRALAAAGAGQIKQLSYGRLPLALPDRVGDTFYRCECAVRSSAVMSFIGLGGLGYRIQLGVDDLRFHQVGTYLVALSCSSYSWTGGAPWCSGGLWRERYAPSPARDRCAASLTSCRDRARRRCLGVNPGQRRHQQRRPIRGEDLARAGPLPA